MYIIKNAWRNIRRAKGRSLLVGLIVLMVSLSACIALVIVGAADSAVEDGLSRLAVTASIDVDRQAIITAALEEGTDAREAMNDIDALSLPELQSYAASDQVQSFYYTIQSSLDGENGLLAVTSSTDTVDAGGQNPLPPGQSTEGAGSRISMGDFTVIGASGADAMTDFSSGSKAIVSGEVFGFGEDNRLCLVSQELAGLNGLEVGDEITLFNPSDATEAATLSIAGIFSSEETGERAGGGFFSSMDPANQIYVSAETLQTIVDGVDEDSPILSNLQGTYVLGSPEALEAFKKDVAEMGLGDTYTVRSSNLDAYNNSLLPLENLRKFALILLAVVLAVGGAVLALFSIFMIRERKYEVGVLTAIGMKKSKVAMQFLAEALIVTIIAVAGGTVIGTALSEPVADAMLAGQIDAIQQEQANQVSQFGRDVGMMGGGAGMGPGGERFETVDSYIDSLNPSMDAAVVGGLAGICLILTLVASAGALIYVMRFEPMRILSERE